MVFGQGKKMFRVKTHNSIAEKGLEQLRWLDNGYSIRVELTEHESFSIDTPEDVKKIAHLL